MFVNRQFIFANYLCFGVLICLLCKWGLVRKVEKNIKTRFILMGKLIQAKSKLQRTIIILVEIIDDFTFQ